MKICLTRKERWELAVLSWKMVDLGGADALSSIKTFNRIRLRLGLTPIQDAMRKGKTIDPAAPSEETAWFDLEDDQVDFILAKFPARVKTGYLAALLGDFFEQLDLWRTSKVQPEGAPEIVEKLVEESWYLDDDAIEVKIRDLLNVADAAQIGVVDVYAKLDGAVAARKAATQERASSEEQD